MEDRIKEEFIQHYKHWHASWNYIGYKNINPALHLLVMISEYKLQFQEIG